MWILFSESGFKYISLRARHLDTKSAFSSPLDLSFSMHWLSRKQPELEVNCPKKDFKIRSGCHVSDRLLP